MNNDKLKMARKIRRGEDDGRFDLEFWQKLGPQRRFEAAWQMVIDSYLMKGKPLAELRFQRSVQNIERRKR